MTQPAFFLTACIAGVAWLALILQYALLIAGTYDGIGPLLGTLRFFSFFTILSNLLVALTTTEALRRRSVLHRDGFFSRPRMRAGVALCIAVTALIYCFVLSSVWAPQGAQWWVDKMLHYVLPLLYIGWWILCVPHRSLDWSDALRWLVFPALFLAWTLVRGAWLHEYPYPFLDVDALGYAAVLHNSVAVGVLFLTLGVIIVALDRSLRRPV